MRTVYNEVNEHDRMQAKKELNTAIVRRLHKLLLEDKISREEAFQAAKLLYVSTEFYNYLKEH